MAVYPVLSSFVLEGRNVFLRMLIALGLLGLTGCVTTPDYRYVSSTGDYASGDNAAGGYYTDDGYYGDDRNVEGGYYTGNETYATTSVYSGYAGAGWGVSPWFGYGNYGYGSYPGWGFGFPGYASYGFTPGWGGYFASSWGGYWGGYGYSPFFGFYVPYWYYSSYYHRRHSDHRDLRAVHAEQLRQANYQRSFNRVPPGSAGSRMWPPGRAVARSSTEARAGNRSEALRQVTLQRAPARTIPRTSARPFRNTRPVAAPRPRYDRMPRGVPGRLDIQRNSPRRASMPVSGYGNLPRRTPATLNTPRPQPRAEPSWPARRAQRPIPGRDRGPGHNSRRELNQQ